MAEASETFKSKTILGLLRSAPDLKQNIKHVERMFVKPDKGEYQCSEGMFVPA